MRQLNAVTTPRPLAGHIWALRVHVDHRGTSQRMTAGRSGEIDGSLPSVSVCWVLFADWIGFVCCLVSDRPAFTVPLCSLSLALSQQP